MIEKIQNFFLELQQSDETTKKRWLVILTSGSMVIVISLWAVYLNFTIANLNEDRNPKQNDFLSVFNNGLQIITDKTGAQLSQVIANLQTLANKTNSVTIQPSDTDFQPKNLEDIKPQKLP